MATEADEDTFTDDEDDDLEDAFDEPDAVKPEPLEPTDEPDRPAPESKPSSTFAAPDVEPGPEQQRPSSN